MERNIILAGVGGQGTILAGQILSRAAVGEGYRVYLFEEHGMAQRGGSVATYFRMGDKIYTPLLLEGTGDALIGFEPVEALRHLGFMKPDGTIVLNTKRLVPAGLAAGAGREYPTLETISTAVKGRFRNLTFLDVPSILEELGTPQVTNTVMLGALSATGVLPISRYALVKAIEELSPQSMTKDNVKAFETGYERFLSTIKR